MNGATPKTTIEQLAQFSFATAVVVRKDFGTDHYKRLLSSVADLEAIKARCSQTAIVCSQVK